MMTQQPSWRGGVHARPSADPDFIVGGDADDGDRLDVDPNLDDDEDDDEFWRDDVLGEVG